jgi:hypothetical protein
MRPCPGNQKKSAEAKTATIITWVEQEEY